MASGAVDDRAVRDVLAIMNEDSPQVDETEEEDVGDLLQRKEEGKDVVRHALGPAVKRVKGVGSEGRGHNPLVVWLVESAVNARVVQSSVNPVDEEVGEKDEDGELEDAVVGEGLLGDGVVELGVAADLEDEEGCSQKSHWGHSRHGLLDFQGNLALQELGVVEGGFIPDEDVGSSRDDEIYEKAEYPNSIAMSMVSF